MSSSKEIISPKSSKKKLIPKPEIIIVGKEGQIRGPEIDYYRKLKLENNQKVSTYKVSVKVKAQSIFSGFPEINEIDKSELVDEIIDPDHQYFLTFCSLIYLMRALHMSYRVFEEIDRKKLVYDFDYDLAIFIVDVFFTVVLISTALNGFFFCWKMYLWFAFPYLMSLFFSTFLMGFRIIAPIIDKNYILKVNIKSIFSLSIFKDDRITEAVLDSGFLLLNLIISFCVTILYKQICEAYRAVHYEPNILEVDGYTYVRRRTGDRISYRLHKEIISGNKKNP